MRIERALAAVAALALAAGCAAQSLGPPAASTRSDTFLPYREMATSIIKARSPEGADISAYLGARRDKQTDALTTHAFLAVVYVQKLGRRYESARNARAEALPFRLLVHDGAACRKQMGCAHMEMFQVDIPEADLRQARAAGEGYPIKLFGRLGHNTLFPIPKELVASLLDEIDRPASATLAAKAPAGR